VSGTSIQIITRREWEMGKGRRRLRTKRDFRLDPEVAARADRVRERIRATRHEKKLTALAMSERMRVSRPFYTQLEGGTRRINLEYLLMMAKALGVDVRDLLAER
jgi:DNA-binding XRE family transcriptional regulator